jgi:S-adenosylmethionine hydrolase
MARQIVTLTTDFGHNDHFVGVLKGVILKLAPETEIVDICHEVRPYDILDGAFTIVQAYRYFPTWTIHLVVVDPGVGGGAPPPPPTKKSPRKGGPEAQLSLIKI